MAATTAYSTERNSVIYDRPAGLRQELGRRARAAWRAWRQRARTRAELAHMSERDFHDFGTTRAQVEFELESPLVRLLRRYG